MSGPYQLEITDTCPYCGSDGQDGEDLADTGYYYSYECCDCERCFDYDAVNEVYYDDNGNLIKNEVN